ncbi:MAG: SGNH/GDSL hydrolase family protein [Verrucomicrobiae bacterium]|nr:SGNH/GDSL hydrolase family protein [Verrucomicrobiae bacterium]
MNPFARCALVLAVFVASISGARADEEKSGGSTLIMLDKKDDAQAIPAVPANPLRLILPPTIHTLSGLETNVYFDNAFLALNPANYAVDVICARGAQQSERWTWTPSADPEKHDLGEFPFAIELRDTENRVVAKAETVLRVRDRKVTAPPEKPLTLLIIGDSLTNASTYSGRVVELADEDSLPLKLIGTRGPGAEAQPDGGDGSGNRHEGYGGWTAERFATKYNDGIARGDPYKECGSPFLYQDESDDAPRLDFARYCDEFNEGAAPDFVTILLGCNDTFNATDETIEERIDTMFAHYETLVKMIHDHNASTRIGAILPMPPSASQDAFGANYGSSQTRWQYRRNQHRVVERMLETFGNREAENLFLVPAWLNVDPVHGFPTQTAKVNAHSDIEIERPSNGVHPSAVGYRQLGDALYAWLRSFDTTE